MTQDDLVEHPDGSDAPIRDGAGEMATREQLVERVAMMIVCNVLDDNTRERARRVIAECEKELATLRSAFADERALRIEQIEMRQSIEAQAAEMRTALRELSGQIIQGRVGFGLAVCPSLDPILAQTELALSTNAGRKVLDVVRAARVVDESAQGRGPQMGAKMQYHIITDDALTALRQALSALGWKP